MKNRMVQEGGIDAAKREQEEYLHQIICVFSFLGEVTQAMINSSVTGAAGVYSVDADFGHYLVFNMAITELKKFGELVGLTVDDQGTTPGGKK